ncbi:MAG: cytochrome P450 alkane hydroxylase [Lasallia pustulata]|uniref:Cytochrome P450 alkane hydroxylase n=1 Tax=Lasallia pustulata TaxID=136370 RepID=A0A5M8PJM6_9LECA|nr:MAG: cytochrome P450 alkane hydroxylase [Lasallia pustulata]
MREIYLLLVALTCVIALYIHNAIKKHEERRADKAIGEQYGCLPPPRLQNQRPLGVDRLEQIFRANTESRLMELFLFHFRQTGYTLEQVFLGTPAFGTVDPANLEAILSTNLKEWGMGVRRAITFPMLGDGIFTQEGAPWKHSREMLRPHFQHRQYDDLEVFRESVDNLIDNIKGGVIDLQPLFFRLTLDTTTAFLFGESVNSLKAPKTVGEQNFTSAFNTAQEYVAKRFRLLDLYWFIGGKKFQEACDNVHRFADQIIDRNLGRGSKDEESFLDNVAKNTPNRDALRGQIINILTAGRDTTACLLSWTFFMLVRHPNVLGKLRTEISSVSQGRGSELNRTDLRNMKYLQNVLKEILRLYPSVPVNSRTALKTTVLPTGGGPDRRSPVLIPKGSAVAYSVYTMHRRPDLYGMDAELFRPERWDEDMPLNQNETNAKWGYLPFNGGPRVCLGMDFALTEAAYTIVRLIQRYPTIKLPEGMVPELVGVERQTMTLVVSVTGGCKIELG